MAERVRKPGRTGLHGIGAVARALRITDNDATFEPWVGLAEQREAHGLRDDARDVATASPLET